MGGGLWVKIFMVQKVVVKVRKGGAGIEGVESCSSEAFDDI